MHPLEYERYTSLKRPYAQQTELLPMFQPILTQPTLPDMDLQQSVVSTIKSEDLEFVDVNQDEMPGETWDSFESSDFYENLDNHQPHAETAASSTTKTIPPKWTEIYESGSNNDAMYGGDSNDESNEYSDSRMYHDSRRPPLLFRGGFFRFLKRDGVSVRAECLNCRHGNVYSGHMWSSSNFIKHLSRMHPKDYERFLAMKADEKSSNHHDRNESQANQASKFNQKDFDRIVLNFMISGMHSPNLLTDPSFSTLLNDIASQRTTAESSTKPYQIISPSVLVGEIDERLSVKREYLIASLKAVSSVSTAIDVWTVRQKTFMSVIVNWIDSKDFQRVSNVIGCEIFNGSETTQSLFERLQKIYCEYDLSNKIVASVTNNNPQYETDAAGNEVKYLQINGLSMHIKSPTHLFELIGLEGSHKALNDEQYAAIHSSAFTKFNALVEHAKGQSVSEKSASILNAIFNHPSIGSKVIEIYNNVSNLVTCDHQSLNEILTEIETLALTQVDIDFLKEYAIILEPIATAIEYLQKNNCYYATLLPMVYSMKDNLMDVNNRGQIQLCQPLLAAILNGVDQHFDHLFDFSSEKSAPAIIATCTHPFFKMRWLKGDLKTPTNTNQILDLLVKAAKKYDGDTKKENEVQGTSARDEQKPPEKKFKFSFDTSLNEETTDETMIQMDFMSFLKKPCQNDETNLEELKLHPWVQKLFMRYNSIISSTAALERSVPLSDLIRKSQSACYTDEIFSKFGLLRAKKLLN
ncbi:uncharacterized protein LOC129573192 isoform X2 [Sitodiplosis mosellana]|uniref:uncharacterized protein LOC129573192 isoform X2 n=1 Tax=Sitodiplosis mosellana TaxID=263140 RepID=UPI0024444425|nr:uncharacterized protein LOC129573192 isoform X2 [Sitodiplosis mosellana]